jgi:hypothetical protein
VDAVIDLVLDLLDLQEWLWLLIFPVAVLVGFFLLGHALPMRLAMAVFGVGTAILAFLAYRLYQSQVDYCKDSPEVSAGGDKFSCLEPQHWFANALAVSFLLLMELGLAILLAGGSVRWWKQRRSERPLHFANPS